MRGKTLIPIGLALVAGALFAGRASGAYTVLYASDFQAGDEDDAWSNPTITEATAFGSFLGRYGPESVELSAETLIGSDLRLTFDLYLIDNWKGDAGDHRFTVEVNGLDVFNETLHSGGGAQSFLGEAEAEGGNIGFRANFDDAIYRNITLDFSAGAAMTVVRFGATGISNNLNIASWGIDNVRLEQQALTVIPAPGGMHLAGLGLTVSFLLVRPQRGHHRSGRTSAPA